MRSRRGQLALASVALLLGLLSVVQLRTQASANGLETLTTQELTLLVGNLNTRNDQLRAEVAALRGQAAQLQAAAARGETSVGQLDGDLARIRAWAGLDGLSGAGVRLTIAGPLDGAAVEDLLNELRNAGAEALSVGGIRVVAGVVVAGSSGSLQVGGRSLGAPFAIEAIGDRDALTAALTRAGGIVAQLSAVSPAVSIVVTPVARIEVPPTDRSLTPVVGRPRG